MADEWRGARIKNIVDRERGRRILAQDDPRGGYLYRAAEAVCDDNAWTALLELEDGKEPRQPTPYGRTFSRDGLVCRDVTEEEFDWLKDLSLRVLRVEGPGAEDMLGTVSRLRDMAVESAPADLNADLFVLSLHYVMTGEYFYHGGPFGPPRPSPLWAVEPPAVASSAFDVAVLDTGSWKGIPDWLAASTTVGPNGTDPLVVAGANPATLDSEGGHGAFIASVIARMAGGAHVRSERALDEPDGVGDDASVARAILAVAAMTPAIPVVCMSFGTRTADEQMPPSTARALRRLSARTLVVAAAGNGQDDDGVPCSAPFWPAADKGAVAVASATPASGSWVASSFSNYGPWVDVCTYGEDVLGVFVDGTFLLCGGSSETFAGGAAWSGTSFATPIVAAEILRQLRANPGVDPSTVWSALRARLAATTPASVTAAQIGVLYDPTTGDRRAGPGIDPLSP